MPLRDQRSRRIVTAVIQNVDAWAERVAEIERHAAPGNKVRALSLLRDMEQARVSLVRLAERDCGGDSED